MQSRLSLAETELAYFERVIRKLYPDDETMYIQLYTAGKYIFCYEPFENNPGIFVHVFFIPKFHIEDLFRKTISMLSISRSFYYNQPIPISFQLQYPLQ